MADHIDFSDVSEAAMVLGAPKSPAESPTRAFFAANRRLRRADLHGANLAMAVLVAADLRDADLTAAICLGADLRFADLSNAKLAGADFGWADFAGARLRGADLAGADLRRCNFLCADLGGANLFGANLSLADLTNAGLANANLEGVLYSPATIWPQGFSPVGRRARLISADGPDQSPPEEDLTVSFAPDLSPRQIQIALGSLADFYRACGGLGFKAAFESEAIPAVRSEHGG